MLMFVLCGMLCFFAVGCRQMDFFQKKDYAMIHTKKDISTLFFKTPAQISTALDAALKDARAKIKAIIETPKKEYSYATVAKALDQLEVASDLAILLNICAALEFVSPDDALRAAAHEAVKKLQEFVIDEIGNNKALYDVFAYYATHVAPTEPLTDEQRYYVRETLIHYKRLGFDLSDEKRNQCAALAKEIAALSQDFERNISQDTTTVLATKDELAGVDPEFLEGLKRDEQGNYLLGLDYPTVYTILDTCAVEQTRKKIYLAFNNRAHPTNKAVLNRLIAARYELATLLSMPSYAQLSLCDEMVGSADKAHAFLHELLRRSRPKQQAEFAALIKELPEGVTLTKTGQLKPWDVGFAKDRYKKKHLALDEQVVAEYFPSTSTIAGLLSIYQQFFNLSFEQVTGMSLWADNLTTIAVYDAKTKELLGYLILDLYPRPHKFTHACHMTIVPPLITDDGKRPPCLSVVLANFPPESATKPALLKRNDVSTFFHEFGHAIHEILGRTAVASFSGTHVKHDFVELPSQMLEEWLHDGAILKGVSKHYKTGQPLPDNLIEAIHTVKNFDSGYFVQRQAFLALVSLAFYGPGAHQDCHQIWKDLVITCIPSIAYEPEAHMYLSFGHLTDYGPRYYGYLWSKVFALDLFENIKKQGLLNPEAGKKYADKVLRPGGSKDPNELLRDYLGREPRQDAFFADMGI